MIFILSTLILTVTFDGNGVMYQDDTFSVLELAPDSLTSYSIPSTVERIKGGSETQSAFYRCRSKLKSIEFCSGSKLKILEEYSFYRCSIEGTLNMSECKELLIINYLTFAYCCFSEVLFPPRLESIMSGAFLECTNLKSVSFPKTLKTISGFKVGFSAPFFSCTSLSSIDWGPNPSISSIGDNAFYGTNLSSIYIPASLINIAGGCFGNTQISHIEVNVSNPNYKSDGNFLMSKGGDIIYFGVQRPKGDGIIDIPTGVNQITSQAFRSSHIKGVNFPSTLVNITDYCFNSCYYLKHLYLPSTIQRIQSFCFSGCFLLESVTFEANVTYISHSLFSSCTSLKELKIPDGVVTLFANCFSDCKNIQRIEIPSSVTTIAAGAFANINRSCEIVFRNGSPMRYEDGVIYTANWSTIIACIVHKTETFHIKQEVTVIGSKSFIGNEVPSIDFGSSQVTNIQQEAFKGSGLTSIRIPSTVISIDEYAFQDCHELSSLEFEDPSNSKLTDIKTFSFKSSSIIKLTLPPSVKNIFDEAFADCKSLRTIELGSGNLRTIGDRCFEGVPATTLSIPSSANNVTKGCIKDSAIATLVINGPSQMTEIKESAFWMAKSLTSITLGSGVENIGDSAFQECTSLETLTLPSGIKTIGKQSFRDCLNLETVIVDPQSELESIGGMAFYGCKRLSEFRMDPNSHFYVKESVVFDRSITSLILYLPGSPNNTFICPPSVASISAYSFAGASNLANVTILNDDMRSIGFQAFLDCTRLSHVRLPLKLQQVDKEAFLGCSSLACGSLVYSREEGLAGSLLAAGVPKEALVPCPTMHFTPGLHQPNDKICPLLSILQDSDGE